MKPGSNRYRVDLRDFLFVLFEQFRVAELLGQAPFEDWDEEQCRTVLKSAQRFAVEVLGPLNEVGDQEGCRLENGHVRTPSGFREAWAALYETGFKTLGVPAELGGQGAPKALRALVEEMLSGANAAFAMYPGLTEGVAELIEAFATPQQRERYLPPLLDGRWAGTMCLTEPQAGSDVGAALTRATRNPDGTFSIQGQKMFISGGDHDLSANIVHMVIARIEGAAAGTKGLSLFIVPRNRVRPDGTVGEPNDVEVGRIEHKLGINGSATCVLDFGTNGQCVGELVGTVEHAGMAQMFRMMNNARIAVGIQGLGIASSAFLNALDYARDRKQGPSFSKWKDPNAPKVPIVEHADVRRMLLDMKARVEGMRAMLVKLAWHSDRAAGLPEGEEEQAAYHRGQVDLLTPLVKAWSSDQAFSICTTAIQAMGGAGFTRDYPLEQYLRDSKVFSIYEGTNHIQAMDLIGRKLSQADGSLFMQFLADVGAFVEQHQGRAELGAAVNNLGAAQKALATTALLLRRWVEARKGELLPAVANRFLGMMANMTVGWLLLDAAVIAEKAMAGLSAEHPDRAFYTGKKWAALHFAREVLPEVVLSAQLIAAEDRSALDVPVESLATV